MKYVYCFYHDDAGFFLKPTISDTAPDQAIVDFQRSLVLEASEYAKRGIQNCSMWYLGTFDEANGLYDQANKMKVMTHEQITEYLKKGLGDFAFDKESANGAGIETAGN